MWKSVAGFKGLRLKNLSASVKHAPLTSALLEKEFQSFEAHLPFSHLAHQGLSKLELRSFKELGKN